MKASLNSLLVVSSVTLTTNAAAEEMATAPGAALCVSPFVLVEAAVAASNRDEAWLKNLGCVIWPAGTAVILIDENSRGRQVKLKLPGGEVTLWGRAGDFIPLTPVPPTTAVPAPSPPPSPPAKTEPSTKTADLPPATEMIERNDPMTVMFVVLKWSRDASKSVVISDSRILNQNNFAIRDVEVGCQQVRTSDGRITSRYSQKIPDIIKAKGVVVIYALRTGLQIPDGTRVTCRVNSFARN